MGQSVLVKYSNSWLRRMIFNCGIFPQQNGYVARFNRTRRYELLNQCLFENIAQVKQQSAEWVWMYNDERSHMANGGMPPVFKK